MLADVLPRLLEERRRRPSLPLEELIGGMLTAARRRGLFELLESLERTQNGNGTLAGPVATEDSSEA